MARRATYLDAIWSEGKPAILVDAGDLFGRRTSAERSQTELLAEVTGTFGYDAVGVGEQDLNYGLPFLQRAMEEYGIPFTTANVRDADGNLVAPEYRVVERGGVRVGIVSVADPAQRIITMTAQDASFTVDDPATALNRVLPRLREEADTIVLLAHLGDAGTEQIIREVDGIDLAVVGHSYRPIRTERVINRTILVNAAHEGQHVGRVDLLLEPVSGSIQAAQVTVTGLDDSIEDDPEVRQRMERHNQKIEEEKQALRASFPRDLGSEDENFLGDNTCKTCHEEIWRDYARTGHRGSFNTLATRGSADDPRCLVCHTTGYRHVNGYDDGPGSGHLTGVQCEACHGYGTEHARDGRWGARARQSCLSCHELSNSPHANDGYEFDYDAYWARIAH
ncbi:MAG: multiheme c-type cytochrome [Candidatus Krumholzibacteriia bacterium]